MDQPGDVTQLLEAVNAGASGARDRLFSAVYDDLRRIAAARMAAERPDHTLQPTALVNEAYLRLIGPNQPALLNRRYFFAAAAEAMRRILIDEARRRHAAKRGGHAGDREDLSDVSAPLSPAADLTEVDRVLREFEEVDAEAAGVGSPSIDDGLGGGEVFLGSGDGAWVGVVAIDSEVVGGGAGDGGVIE